MSSHPDYEEIDRVYEPEGDALAVIHRRRGGQTLRFKLCREILVPDRNIEEPAPTTVYMEKRHIAGVCRLMPLLEDRIMHLFERHARERLR